MDGITNRSHSSSRSSLPRRAPIPADLTSIIQQATHFLTDYVMENSSVCHCDKWFSVLQYIASSEAAVAELTARAAAASSQEQVREMVHIAEQLYETLAEVRRYGSHSSSYQLLVPMTLQLLNKYLAWPVSAAKDYRNQYTYAELVKSIIKYCDKSGDRAAASSLVPQLSALIPAAIKLNAWELASAAADMMAQHTTKPTLTYGITYIPPTQASWQEIAEGALQAMELLLLLRVLDVAGNDMEPCCNAVQKVLVNYGYQADEQDVAQLVGISGVVAAIHGQLSGALADRHSSSAVADMERIGLTGIMCGLRHLAGQQLQQAGAVEILDHLLALIDLDSQAYTDLQKVWAAAAVYCPEVFASQQGHQRFLRHVIDAPPSGPCTSVAVSATFKAYRWLLDSDPCFLTSQELEQHLQQHGNVYEEWLSCNASIDAIVATVYHIHIKGMQSNAAYNQPRAGSCTATAALGYSMDCKLAAGAVSTGVLEAAVELLTAYRQAGGQGMAAEVLKLLLGFVNVQARDRYRNWSDDDSMQCYSCDCRKVVGMDRLWALLASVDVCADGGSKLQLCTAVTRVLALMLDMGLMKAPAGVSVPALVVSSLTELLRGAVRRHVEGCAGPVEWAARCLCALMGGAEVMMRKMVLALVLPVVGDMLGSTELSGCAVQVLAAVASSRPDVQELVLGHQGLVQGLVGLLPEVEVGGQGVVQVVSLLRVLVLGNAGAQLAVAQLPGAVSKLVALLVAEGDVGNEAAETLAALQRDNDEVQVLVRQVTRGVQLQLGQ